MAIFIFGLFSFGLVRVALAQTPATPVSLGLTSEVQQNIGLASTDIRVIIAQIIRVALGFLGVLALGLMLYGGFVWMTSGGNEQKISDAKKIIINGVIGLAIILSSFAITSFIINKLVDATGGGTGSGPGGGCGASCPYSFGLFYVAAAPPSGQYCVRNAKPAVVFNQEVDKTTIPGNIVVKLSSTGVAVAGTWDYGPNNATVLFTPTGDCLPSPGNDCFLSNTAYTFEFANSNNIKSVLDPTLALDCNYGATCNAVNFTSGDAVDRLPPTVTITAPPKNSSIQIGTTPSFNISYADDNGVQNVTLTVSNPAGGQPFVIGSITSPTCQKTGSVTIPWNTTLFNSADYTATASGLDYAGLSGTDTGLYTLRPAHCFNAMQDDDETGLNCGGATCGACAGGSCTANNQCASGSCVNGVCVNQMSITSFSPPNGATSTFVSVLGRYFGTVPGHVYFGKSAQPSDPFADWVEAFPPPVCGIGFSYWADNQIIVQVPNGTSVSTPIKVVTAPTASGRSANDATRYGTTSLVAGRIGEAFNFTGTNSFLGFSYAQLTDNFTISYWSKTDSYTYAYGPSGGMPFGGDTTAQGYLWELSDTDIQVSNNGETKNFRPAYQLSADYNWKNITVVVENAKVSVYKNGVFVSSTQFASPFTISAARIGMAYSAGYNYRGQIDDVRIYNRPLTGTDVQQLYNMSGTQLGLVGWWTMDAADTTATTVKDMSVTTVETDITSNHALPNFQVNSTIRPGICSLTSSNCGGTPCGAPGDTVSVIGKNFGVLPIAADGVFFDTNKANLTSGNAWTDTLISAVVPGILAGDLSVAVKKNGVESNKVKFTVNQIDPATYPTITSVSPTSGPAGQYITVTGRNFGALNGKVSFTAGATQLDGDFSFPAACQANVWSDTQVIVKAPVGITGQSYTVQIETGESPSKTSLINPSQSFKGASGPPGPGICSISPGGGPIPLPSGQKVTLQGEYFTPATDKVDFWGVNSTIPSVDTNRPQGVVDVANSDSYKLLVTPDPATQTGAVTVWRASDTKMSNPVNFNVADCTANANKCSDTNYQCCTTGGQTGMCILGTSVCAGTLRFTGYEWRFSTKDIPQPPAVVERCGATTEVSPPGMLPSPSPSTQWGADPTDDAQNVCNSALVTIEFTSGLDQGTVDENSVKVNKCAAGSTSTYCKLPTTPVNLTNGSFTLITAATGRVSLSLKRNAPWAADTWYQVSLGTGIKAPPVTGDPALFLVPSKPCDTGTAYCFMFRGGGQDCVLRSVIVTPYSYWTELLESPMQRNVDISTRAPVDYFGNGLSTQKCIMMDMSGYNWTWSSLSPTFASIHTGFTTGQRSQVDTLGNTVGVGIAGNSVDIQATATKAPLPAKSGTSPLTIDLSNPKVTAWWPACAEACSNAAVGVQFNTLMSNKNLGNAVRIYKCLDENCLGTVDVTGSSGAVALNSVYPTNIDIANSSASASPLENDTIYLVTVSNASANPLTALNNLWARKTLSDPASFGKPYDQQFSWRFRTKKDTCAVSRVQILPAKYTASSITDRAVFGAQPFSAPDSCSSLGEKLNPWKSSWDWSSSDPLVASINEFSTQGYNPACTANCTLRGSTIASNISPVPSGICGNGVVEAGEDCDVDAAVEDPGISCTSNCLRPGNPNAGAGSLQCGNGTVDTAKGEECDGGVGCSATCLHLGSSSNAGAALGGGQTSATTINYEYKMWYTGIDGSNDRIYLATSTDGVNWKKYNNSTPLSTVNSGVASTNGWIPLGGNGSGDGYGVSNPSVIKDGNVYKMWYTGDRFSYAYKIYYATSPDGINWTKVDNSDPTSQIDSGTGQVSSGGQIPLGSPGTGDSVRTGFPSVIKDGGIYKMWYAGHDGSMWRIFYATSLDGLAWTKFDNSIPSSEVDSGQTSSNGQLPDGSAGKGDDFGTNNPMVVKANDGTYKMWYFGLGSGGSDWHASYYATSPDGLRWTKYNNTPPQNSDLTGTDGRIPFAATGDRGDVVITSEPTVIRDGSIYKMWYTGRDNTVGNYRVRIYYAETDASGQTLTKKDNTIPAPSDDHSTNGRIPLGSNNKGDDVGVSGASVIKELISGGPGVGSSICGNGLVGVGEDCETGIASSYSNPLSALGCSNSCLHLGTKIFSQWCFDNKVSFGGFPQPEYNTICSDSISRCGNGITEPDEDVGCDTGSGQHASFCNDNCLFNNVSKQKCAPNTDGCDKNGQYLGSSLTYGGVCSNDSSKHCTTATQGVDCNIGSVVGTCELPSVCGDGVVGLGEQSSCEANLINFSSNNFTNPWALAIGVGMGAGVGTPPEQSTDIKGETASNGVNFSGIGKFVIPCGYEKDADCAAFNSNGVEYGVGADTCCYARPTVIGTTPPDSGANICRNSALRVDFNGIIDQGSLSASALDVTSSIIIARGELGTTCAFGERNVTALAVESGAVHSESWFAKIFAPVKRFFSWLFGLPADAAFTPTIWCAGADPAFATVEKLNDTTSRINIALQRPLLADNPYLIVLTPGVKDTKGVSMGYINGKNFSFRFSTGSNICQIDRVNVSPSSWYFSTANATARLTATALSNFGAIQPITGSYEWFFKWGPTGNSSVTVPPNVTVDAVDITSQNKNGEVDVRAVANVTVSNLIGAATGAVSSGSSHITVFLCENPWPVKLFSATPVFPYSDSAGNHSGFNNSANSFDGSAIPASDAGVGDGYFNFSTYYCADAASFGTLDDRPYLRPTVQATSANLQVAHGSCEATGDVCDEATAAADCNRSITLIDGSFEAAAPVTPPDSASLVDASSGTWWRTTASSQKIQEFWNQTAANDAGGLMTGKYIELDKYSVYQDLATIPGTTFHWSFFHRGREGTDTMKVSIGASGAILVNQTIAGIASINVGGLPPVGTPLDSDRYDWGFIEGDYTVPFGQTLTRFSLDPISSANTSGLGNQVDNVKITLKPLTCFINSPIKRFIFTNDKNCDAIGIQIFRNPKHLSPMEWYSSSRSTGGQGFQGAVQSSMIDGYPAATDGNNIYVGGLNYSNSNLYDVIYLFSVDTNATKETKGVFEDLMKNLHFNTNLTFNDGYCGNSISAPLYVDKCSSDLDCPTGQVCSAQIAKLQRDYQRINDLKSIDVALQSFNVQKSAYPKLPAGTFLPGQSISTWPSWSSLGTELGSALPDDPVNKLGKGGTCKFAQGVLCLTDGDCPAGDTCTLHDPSTGWSEADARFSFACTTSSLAYRYSYSTSTGYTVSSHFEDPGVTIGNLNGFIDGFGFSDTSLYPGLKTWTSSANSTGICETEVEIASTAAGVCGDMVKNILRGEQCESTTAAPTFTPQEKYDKSQCTLTGGNATETTCDTYCHWLPPQTVTCASLSVCGNSVRETGEVCDDGNDPVTGNGTYNHCASDCRGLVSFPPGYCGDGQNYTPSTGSDPEVCDPGQIGVTKYATAEVNSCSAGCQMYGPYCGDSEVYSPNENCDRGKDTSAADYNGKVCVTTGGVPCTYCSNTCQLTTVQPLACNYIYNAWGTCTSDGAGGAGQIRTVQSVSPSNCAGAPVLSQTCTICNYTYSYGTCSWDGSVWSQPMTVLSQSPAGCSGTPQTSQSCLAPSCSYTYTAGSCIYSGSGTTWTQTLTNPVATPAGCTGVPLTSQTCPAPTCTSFAYTTGACIYSGSGTTWTQALSNPVGTPTGCTGGTPLTSQTCAAPTCTSFTYTTGACLYSGSGTVWNQTLSNPVGSPTGCTGGSPLTTQTCAAQSCTYTYTPGTCTWTGTGTSWTQTPVVASASPSGCTGTPDLTPQPCTAQTCTYTYSGWGSCAVGTGQTRTYTSSPAGCVGTPVTTQTCCGDGTAQTPNGSGVTEICDAGAANGTACTPTYNNSCTYCNST
ncbi:MAG: LamG-like jellyroll fold domain-containing protein, partial [Patescibacteria group bacterium]